MLLRVITFLKTIYPFLKAICHLSVYSVNGLDKPVVVIGEFTHL